jgi:hypothetical protein
MERYDYRAALGSFSVLQLSIIITIFFFLPNIGIQVAFPIDISGAVSVQNL